MNSMTMKGGDPVKIKPKDWLSMSWFKRWTLLIEENYRQTLQRHTKKAR